MYRTQTKKTRGLRREHVARILGAFAVYVPGAAYERQWAHAVGVAIGAGYMVLRALTYFKRAPCAFRASVARGLYVLAGYADAARPSRPRSSWFRLLADLCEIRPLFCQVRRNLNRAG